MVHQARRAQLVLWDLPMFSSSLTLQELNLMGPLERLCLWSRARFSDLSWLPRLLLPLLTPQQPFSA